MGAPEPGERVEADEQLAVTGDDVAEADQGFRDERVGLICGTGVVPAESAGEGGFGVVGSQR
jgi:hypothetical protein